MSPDSTADGHGGGPVTVERPESPGRIVVGVDGSAGSAVALRWALQEGTLRQVPVHLLLTWSMPSIVGMGPLVLLADVDLEGAAREALAAALREQGTTLEDRPVGSPVTAEVVEGSPAKALLTAAQDAALLVVGTRGHGGFAGLLLGSVSQQCVAHARCPVVVVHADTVQPRLAPERAGVGEQTPEEYRARPGASAQVATA